MICRGCLASVPVWLAQRYERLRTHRNDAFPFRQTQTNRLSAFRIDQPQCRQRLRHPLAFAWRLASYNDAPRLAGCAGDCLRGRVSAKQRLRRQRREIGRRCLEGYRSQTGRRCLRRVSIVPTLDLQWRSIQFSWSWRRIANLFRLRIAPRGLLICCKGWSSFQSIETCAEALLACA